MAIRWISNTSPIISLARAGAADLLWRLSDELVIPAAVAEEIRNFPKPDAAQSLVTEGRFRIIDNPLIPAEVAAWDLGKGESAILAYALANPGWVCVLDDGSARKAAGALGVPHLGTLAVIVRAQIAGEIASARDLIVRLRSHGSRLNEELVREILATIEES